MKTTDSGHREDRTLGHFVQAHHDELVARCRRRVALRLVPPPTARELEHGIPMFLRQMADMLSEKPPATGEIKVTASQHGGEMHLLGFTIAQVVHDYGDACQTITELAIERSVAISTADFRALNDCLDNAIADAVTEFSRQRELEVSAVGKGAANERLGGLAHELRNFLNSATLALEVLRTGGVGIRGSTADVLRRSLVGMGNLINDTLTGVRPTAETRAQGPIGVRRCIEEAAAAARLQAESRGLRLTVTAVADDVAVPGDRQILASIVSNFLHNALKFTRPGTEVVLSTRVTQDRVLIDVTDECGGLPAGLQERLFRPFEQASPDRSGVGLGLAICRRGADALGAKVSVRDHPGAGCTFTVDLARSTVPGESPADFAGAGSASGGDAAPRRGCC